MADVALAREGNAERAMDEKFQIAPLRVGSSADALDIVECQFARKHDLRKAHVLQKTRLLRRTNVGLRAGMQLQRRQVNFE